MTEEQEKTLLEQVDNQNKSIEELKKSNEELSTKYTALEEKYNKTINENIEKEKTVDDDKADLFDEYCSKKYNKFGGKK